MPGTRFYVETVLRNEVFGIPLGSGPEAWRQGLGDQLVDDVRNGMMRRDHGLDEISFEKRDLR